MEPALIIFVIVIAVILLVAVLAGRSKGDTQFRQARQSKDAKKEEYPGAAGWGSPERDAKASSEEAPPAPQQQPVQRGGMPTGPVASSAGGYPLPPKPSKERAVIEDGIFAPTPVKPTHPIAAPPLVPPSPPPPVDDQPPQWQSAEPLEAIADEVPPLDDDFDALELPPEPAKAGVEDSPVAGEDAFGEKLDAEPTAPIIREREEAAAEVAVPTPEPTPTALDDEPSAPPPVPQPASEAEEQENLIRRYVEPTTEEIEKWKAAHPHPVNATPKSEVNFTAFYPRTAQATQRYGLFIYAHLPTALTTVQTDAQKFTSELGGNVPAPRTTKQPAQIADGQPITITPECEGLTFDPPTLTKRWDALYVRYEFDFKATADQIGDELQGRALIAVAGIEVAQLKFTIEVIALEETPPSMPNANALVGEAPSPAANTGNRVMNVNSLVPPPNNPLAAAKSMAQTEPTKMYAKIFVSYSRKDKAVAEAYRLAQLALGNDVFMDTYSIRTGEDWRVALAKAIDSADVFQLFWSENAATSDNVHDEWDYALHYRCPDNRCADFIRPVYWKPPSPTPTPPAELSHLNFRFVPLAND